MRISRKSQSIAALCAAVFTAVPLLAVNAMDATGRRVAAAENAPGDVTLVKSDRGSVACHVAGLRDMWNTASLTGLDTARRGEFVNGVDRLLNYYRAQNPVLLGVTTRDGVEHTEKPEILSALERNMADCRTAAIDFETFRADTVARLRQFAGLPVYNFNQGAWEDAVPEYAAGLARLGSELAPLNGAPAVVLRAAPIRDAAILAP